MRCLNCGADLSISETICPLCNTPRPQPPPQFSELETKFISLQKRYRAEEIDLVTYNEQVQNLILQDQTGVSWWLGGETGEWHRHDGQNWMPHDPPVAEAKPSSPASQSEATRAKARTKWPFLVIPVLLILLCLCVAVMYFSGVFDSFTEALMGSSETTEVAQATGDEPAVDQPTPVLGSDIPPPMPLEVTLSDEQQLIVDEFGWPDSFTILEADVDQGKPVRYETWTYYKGLITFTFFDGMFQVEGDAEVLPTGFISTPHTPVQFALGAKVDQVQVLLPEYPLVPIENSEIIDPEAQMYVAQQLVLGFIENKLFYVDALSFVPEGSE